MVYDKNERLTKMRVLYSEHIAKWGEDSLPWKRFYSFYANGNKTDEWLVNTDPRTIPAQQYKPRRPKKVIQKERLQRKISTYKRVNNNDRMEHIRMLHQKHIELWGDDALDFSSFYTRIHKMKWSDDRAVGVKPVHRKREYHERKNPDFVSKAKPKKKQSNSWNWESAIIGFCAGVATCLLYAMTK